MAYCDRRVLSIQSHVVSGYVGNKAAVLPMQVLGYEVDAINSVQLPNHTHYKYFQGQVLNAEELRTLFDSLVKNDIHCYSHVLTGYVGSPSFLLEVIKVVTELKAKNPNIIYLCDPVLGDRGKFYVPEENLAIYRDQLLKLSDIITPNQFEAETMSGVKITNDTEALRAMDILHQKGPNTVILSSYESGDSLCTLATTIKGKFPGRHDEVTPLIKIWCAGREQFGAQLCGFDKLPMTSVGNIMTQTSFPTFFFTVGLAGRDYLWGAIDGKKVGCRLETSKIGCFFVGSGDLFSALALVWLHKHPDNFQLAVEKTVSTMYTVLRNTEKAVNAIVQPGSSPSVAQRELRIVDSIRDIQEGKVTVTATPIEF